MSLIVKRKSKVSLLLNELVLDKNTIFSQWYAALQWQGLKDVGIVIFF